MSSIAQIDRNIVEPLLAEVFVAQSDNVVDTARLDKYAEPVAGIDQQALRRKTGSAASLATTDITVGGVVLRSGVSHQGHVALKPSLTCGGDFALNEQREEAALPTVKRTEMGCITGEGRANATHASATEYGWAIEVRDSEEVYDGQRIPADHDDHGGGGRQVLDEDADDRKYDPERGREKALNIAREREEILGCQLCILKFITTGGQPSIAGYQSDTQHPAASQCRAGVNQPGLKSRRKPT